MYGYISHKTQLHKTTPWISQTAWVLRPAILQTQCLQAITKHRTKRCMCAYVNLVSSFGWKQLLINSQWYVWNESFLIVLDKTWQHPWDHAEFVFLYSFTTSSSAVESDEWLDLSEAISRHCLAEGLTAILVWPKQIKWEVYSIHDST